MLLLPLKTTMYYHPMGMFSTSELRAVGHNDLLESVIKIILINIKLKNVLRSHE